MAKQGSSPSRGRNKVAALFRRLASQAVPLRSRRLGGSGRRLRRLLAVSGTLLAVQLLASCDSKHAPASKLVGGPTYALSGASPSIGNIGGIDFSIPQHYLLSRVVYAGQNTWTYRSKQEAPSYKRAIDNIDILLRLSNLEPIRSQADWNDWIKALDGKPFLYETWLTGTVWGRAEMYPSDGTYKTIIPRYWESSAPFGKFDTHAPNEYGLAHYLVKRQRSGTPGELYFDPETWTNLITCETFIGVPPRGVTISSCEDDFLIPGLHGVVVKVHFAKSQLYRWREIQARITQIVDSWVVQPKVN